MDGNVGLIYLSNGTDIHGKERINRKNFGDALTFNPALPTSQSFTYLLKHLLG